MSSSSSTTRTRGARSKSALGWTLGRARVLTPVAIGVGGAALLLRPVLPALRPLRTGALCVFGAVTLALAAGMLGLSSGSPQGSSVWSSAHLQSHGGIAGQALFELTHRLVQSVGADILAVFLFIAGVILVSGATLAGAIRDPAPASPAPAAPCDAPPAIWPRP
jgi:S-DNA-T family DNA segregation ATPase FtsK/SpoIIIE